MPLVYSFYTLFLSLWPNADVPYELVASFTPQEQRIIKYAMDAYRKHTCINFHERTANDMYYVAISRRPNAWCTSHMGRMSYFRSNEGKFMTPLNMDPACFDLPAMIHELMHSIGFHHEHQREDRDPRAISRDPDPNRNFWNSHTISRARAYYIGEYDSESIMHYPFPDFKPYQRMYFTQSDVDNINKLYKCPTNENSIIKKSDVDDAIRNAGSVWGRNVFGRNTNAGYSWMSAARRNDVSSPTGTPRSNLPWNDATKEKTAFSGDNFNTTRNILGRNARRENNTDTAPSSPTRRRNEFGITEGTRGRNGRRTSNQNDLRSDAFTRTNAIRMSSTSPSRGRDETITRGTHGRKGTRMNNTDTAPSSPTRRRDESRITEGTRGRIGRRTSNRNDLRGGASTRTNAVRISSTSPTRRRDESTITRGTHGRKGRRMNNTDTAPSSPTRRRDESRITEGTRGRNGRRTSNQNDLRSDAFTKTNAIRMSSTSPSRGRDETITRGTHGRKGTRMNNTDTAPSPTRRRDESRITEGTRGRIGRRTSNRNDLRGGASTRTNAVRISSTSPTRRRDESTITRGTHGRKGRRMNNTDTAPSSPTRRRGGPRIDSTGERNDRRINKNDLRDASTRTNAVRMSSTSPTRRRDDPRNRNTLNMNTAFAYLPRSRRNDGSRNARKNTAFGRDDSRIDRTTLGRNNRRTNNRNDSWGNASARTIASSRSPISPTNRGDLDKDAPGRIAMRRINKDTNSNNAPRVGGMTDTGTNARFSPNSHTRRRGDPRIIRNTSGRSIRTDERGSAFNNAPGVSGRTDARRNPRSSSNSSTRRNTLGSKARSWPNTSRQSSGTAANTNFLGSQNSSRRRVNHGMNTRVILERNAKPSSDALRGSARSPANNFKRRVNQGMNTGFAPGRNMSPPYAPRGRARNPGGGSGGRVNQGMNTGVTLGRNVKPSSNALRGSARSPASNLKRRGNQGMNTGFALGRNMSPSQAPRGRARNPGGSFRGRVNYGMNTGIAPGRYMPSPYLRGSASSSRGRVKHGMNTGIAPGKYSSPYRTPASSSRGKVNRGVNTGIAPGRYMPSPYPLRGSASSSRGRIYHRVNTGIAPRRYMPSPYPLRGSASSSRGRVNHGMNTGITPGRNTMPWPNAWVSGRNAGRWNSVRGNPSGPTRYNFAKNLYRNNNAFGSNVFGIRGSGRSVARNTRIARSPTRMDARNTFGGNAAMMYTRYAARGNPIARNGAGRIIVTRGSARRL